MAVDRDQPKPKGNSSSASNRSKTSESIKYFMSQLAMALGVVIPAERSMLYIHALSDLTEKQLAFGFERALQLFRPEYGKTFPAPAEIRDWAYQWKPEVNDSRAILDRGEKPSDWEPLKPGEFERML